jgi:hypothetical protein
MNYTQLTSVVDKAIRKLGKEVVRVRYNIGEDHSGDPSMFFRIVLSDAASREDTLMKVTKRIKTILYEEIHPIENWGLFPYFNFRSKSEQAERKGKDPGWD